ncbi:MAG: (2Fe-2S) ferredoxin domain-containing protein [Verrucomicrobiae bacterium]|nr:(2Fe-2S) ferredoxin domain-containing protein [Verrucomicrobiae bacterium]MCP5524451.1 (2Fe-2S) ferredoxin domain-containing protein [Verrucomicrobiales bacterium]
MTKPTHHIFVCGSFRATGAQGVCHKKDSSQLLQYFEEEATDRGLDGVMVSSTGCLKLCDRGPVVVVYPEGTWYQSVTEEVADEILDAIEQDTVAEAHVLA